MFLDLQREGKIPTPSVVNFQSSIESVIRTVGNNILHGSWKRGTQTVNGVVVVCDTTPHKAYRQATIKHNGRTITMLQSNPQKVVNADVKVMLYEMVGGRKRTGQYNSQTGDIKWF